MVSPITKRARELRNNPTEAEKALWQELKATKFKFRRQYPIGPYFADFACKDSKLIIEVDGGQHNIETDHIRTEYLEKHGYRVIRFWNNSVLNNIDGVMEKIVEMLNTPPHPPRTRGGHDAANQKDGR